MMVLKDKVAIITGGASGQGKASAKLFAEEGATVIFADLNEEGGKAVQQEINDAGFKAHFYKLDVSDEEAVISLVNEVKNKYGRIDVLFNNAGIGFGAKYKMASVVEADTNDWKAILDINLNSVFYFTKHVLPVMIEQKSGSVINNSSAAGLVGQPGADAYTASKGAIISLTRVWAVTYGVHNIRVNCICPGSIDTPMMTTVLDMKPEAKEYLPKITPLGRLGKPEEIANTALFLASEKAGYITGAIISVDGGWTAK
ncbi:glucose 1-dehydrogenase [Paenibacillus validus]|nr:MULTISPECIES: glucose 1-dehydrogenase [Paenibacillus]MED4603246.1 glucose 1-dehydrogenase [Paenibacillus validus]MED4609337.1 glucose 1-dehydrogenase [Paenibacillus validus]